MDSLSQGLMLYAILLVSLTFHEFGHAWTALRCGDDTAQRLGRVTLNPLAHADLIGTVIFPLVQIFAGVPLIGWAKPVPFDPRKLRHPKRDDILISAAGPIANVILAVCGAILLRVFGFEPLQGALVWLIRINILLAVFNLIPIVPLDGSWILYHVLPPDLAARYQSFGARWGFAVLLLLVYTGATWRWVRAASSVLFPVLETISGVRLRL